MALSTTTRPTMSAAHLLLQHEEDEDIFLPSPILQEILGMAPTIDKPLLSLLLSRQVMALSTTTRPAMSAAPLLLQHEEDEDIFLPSPILQEI
ncbi:hypothetical protein E2562_033228 [Oryza meyeriana var. granulata]|uniref:Uncharacterized protein n=1 Tax=Oryza meyeriana var. granulata TaxID=110450 RepID=A0A6G1BP87_9ORYZ|nr:hypothetical protein E2562_033228 [Oryza meyeriana var. granulata]